MTPEASEHSGTRARRVLTLVAILPILATVYQTLVLTDLADGDIRRGIESDPGDSTWLTAAWSLSTLYGVFGGLGLSKKFGPRNTLILGLLWFVTGNWLCGRAEGFAGMMVARAVEGLGKGICIILLRSFLLSRFDSMLFAAVLCYGLFAYTTRGTSPLAAAWINEVAGWRWIYWANVPVALGGVGMILLFVPPDAPAPPAENNHSPGTKPDTLVIHLLVTWLMSLLFILGWRAREGGLTSNLFAALVAGSCLVFAALCVRLARSLKRGDSLGRLLRSRTYLCAMGGRMLLLLHLAAVLGVISKYLVELRAVPAVTAGLVFVPVTLSMAAGFLVFIGFRNRDTRHLGLLAGVIGSSLAVYWLANVNLTTPLAEVSIRLAVWGFFLGALPASFLIDEVECLDKSDLPVAAAFAIVVLATPLILVPAWMGTAVSDGKETAFDHLRASIRSDRPVVMATLDRSLEHFTARGMDEVEAPALSAGLLAVIVKLQAATMGIQSGLRLLAQTTGLLGLALAIPLLFAPGMQKVVIRGALGLPDPS